MSISNSPSLVIQKYLIAQDIFTLPSDGDTWPVYLSSMPDGNDVENNAALVTDEMPSNEQVMAGEVVRHFGISIQVRALDYETGYLKLKDVLTDLSDVHKVTVIVGANSYYFWTASKFGGVSNLGTELGTKRRYNFELKCNITLEEL